MSLPPAIDHPRLDALGVDGVSLPAVVCSFEIRGVEVRFSVRHATFTEELSRPYVVDVLAEADRYDVDADALVGRSCEFSFDRGALLRTVHGVVQRVDLVDGEDGSAATRMVRVRMGPALAMLGLRVHSRVFQGLDVLDIVRTVLLGESAPRGGPAEGLAAFGRIMSSRGVDQEALEPPRDYCVQYRESDLDFVSRLLEDEGIAFWFDHEQHEHEVVCLAASNAPYVRLETLQGTAHLSWSPHEGLQSREALMDLSWERTRRADCVLRRHWDWLEPTRADDHVHGRAPEHDAATITTASAGTEHPREVYSGERLDSIHDDEDARARRDEEALRASEWVARGSSNATGLAAGRIFEQSGEVAPTVLVVAVTHQFDATSVHGIAHARYDNHFVGIPSERVFRPARITARPMIPGPQTAIVSGPPGEEIHTDAHGRIRVVFPWNRLGRDEGQLRVHNERSTSAWVRVAQAWAGPGWGTLFLPRVGMEVVVVFLEGNPDRPLVVGCVYDGANRPPYVLPDERTKSTIKTASSPGGNGNNELRFEDAAGHEQIYIHGQRDYDLHIERRHTMHVGENQSYHVGGDRSRTVDGCERVLVEGNQAITVHGTDGRGVNGISIEVDDHWELRACKTAKIHAPERIELVCQGSRIVLEPGRITMHAGDGAEIVLDANLNARSNAGTRMILDADAKIYSSNEAFLELGGDVTLCSKRNAEVRLEDFARISGEQGGTGLFDANARIFGETAHVEGGGGLSPPTRLSCTASDATLNSPAISLEGEQRVLIEGGGGRGVFEGGRGRIN